MPAIVRAMANTNEYDGACVSGLMLSVVAAWLLTPCVVFGALGLMAVGMVGLILWR